MRNQYIFDIPIYRCPKQKHTAQVDDIIAKELSEVGEIFQCSIEMMSAGQREIYGQAEMRIRCSIEEPWEFNQVIGWLRLYVEPSFVGAETWMVDAKKIQRVLNRKRFFLRSASNVLATHFYPEDDSAKIHHETLRLLEGLAKSYQRKGRFLDLENFRNISSFLNWRGLLDARSLQLRQHDEGGSESEDLAND